MIPGQSQQFFEAAAAQSGAAAGYEIERSLRYNSTDSAYLNRTPSSAGNRRTWTWSGWVKRGKLSSEQNIFGTDSATGLYFQFETSDKFRLLDYTGSAANYQLRTTQVFRDPGAWLHIVFALDTTLATADDRIKLYINGEQITAFDARNNPTQNYEGVVNSITSHTLGRLDNQYYIDLYLADVHFIDGQALAASDFGEYDSNNVWQPKEYSFVYGGLNQPERYFSTGISGSLDTSGGGAASVAFNGSIANINTNGVYPSVGNTATWTPANSDLATTAAYTSTARVYVKVDLNGDAGGLTVVGANGSQTISTGVSGNSYGWVDISAATSPLTSIAWSRASSGSQGVRLLAVELDGEILQDNFGGNSFHLPFSDNSSAAALGYDAAATQPALAPRSGMDVVTYTGNGSDQTITDLNFKPDFVWVKARNAASTPHLIVDSVRGGSKVIESHSTGAQVDYRNIGGCITAFLDNGFSTGSNADIATNGRTYVAWCWKAGGTAVSNTDGTITSSVSANTDYGFSVVNIPGYTYPTKTAGHGLGVAPAFIISKNTGTSNPWIIYHQSTGVNTYLQFDTGAGYTGVSGVWSGITSSVFPLNQNVNQQTDIVAYCWSEVSGFSKFDSYSGGTANQTISTGFKPRYLLIKRTDAANSWLIFDSSRGVDKVLKAESSGAETTASTGIDEIEFLSTGFKLISTNNGINGAGGTYIYAAFADRPGNNWDVNNIIAQGNDYANGFTGTERSGFEWVYLFNGNVNQGSVPAVNSTWTWTPSSPISFTTLALYAYKDSSPGDLEINGTSVISQIPNHNGVGTNQRTVITGISSPLTSIKNISLGSLANVVVAGIEIDGTLLVSSPNANIDSLIDTPTDYEADSGNNGGNYATLNPLSAGTNAVLANGNLDWSTTSASNFLAQSTIAMPSGKWYCEYTATSINNMVGIQRVAGTVSTSFVGGNADSWGYYGGTGNKYNNNTNTSYGATYTTNDVVGIALDLDAGTLTFYKNGSSQGQAYSGLTNGPYTFVTGNGANVSGVFNFGQRPFAYTPPTGYKSLCTTNLTDPTIADSSTAMDAKLYTGNGSTQTISGYNFSPDLVWMKSRSNAVEGVLFDTVRGVDNGVFSSLSSAEFNSSQTLNQFNSDGFQLGGNAHTNFSAYTYVGWAWDGGTSTVSNTDGSITSSVRANASAGFSIVGYTGTGSNASVGHGLNAAPELLIIKNRTDTENWFVWSSSGFSIPARNGFYLDLTADVQNFGLTSFNDTLPTSSIITLGTNNILNGSGDNLIAYCFASVDGFSSFGSYTGNGSTDGPFIYTGFRPAWLMVKVVNLNGESWVMKDSSRGTYNPNDPNLYANLNIAEQTGNTTRYIDFLSNGFKLRGTEVSVNGNGYTFIYACFAEYPFKTARAR